MGVFEQLDHIDRLSGIGTVSMAAGASLGVRHMASLEDLQLAWLLFFELLRQLS